MYSLHMHDALQTTTLPRHHSRSSANYIHVTATHSWSPYLLPPCSCASFELLFPLPFPDFEDDLVVTFSSEPTDAIEPLLDRLLQAVMVRHSEGASEVSSAKGRARGKTIGYHGTSYTQ